MRAVVDKRKEVVRIGPNYNYNFLGSACGDVIFKEGGASVIVTSLLDVGDANNQEAGKGWAS